MPPRENLAGPAELGDLCRQAIARLEEAFEQPAEQVQRKVDEAENLAAELRDALIDRLRAGRRAESPPQTRTGDAMDWRRPLDQVNLAISLIAGVAYPGSRINRSYVEDAQHVLQDILSEPGWSL